MKIFLAFIKKEIFHILRDKRTLLILFVLPVILVILFGFAITNEIQDAKVAILDYSEDNITHEITNKLLSSGYFLLNEKLQHPDDIEDIFRKGDTKMVLVFANNFQKYFYDKASPQPQIQLIADASDPNTATSLINFASAIIRDYQLEQSPIRQIPLQIKTEVKMMYNPLQKSVFMFVPGVMTVILMLVSALMTSIALTREKEQGNMEVLLVSPLKPPLIIIGKVIPYAILALINTFTILFLAIWVFDMPMNGDWGLLIGECAIFILCALALGIFISTRTDSQQVAMLMSLVGLLMPSIILSGFMFPIENMPRPLQVISNAIPAKWFIVIVKDVMLKGLGWEYVWKESAILLGMTFLFLVASIKNFKVRLS